MTGIWNCDLQNAEGKRPEALKSYQDGLKILKRLVALDQPTPSGRPI